MNRETLRLAVTIPFAFALIVMYDRWEEFVELRTEASPQPIQAQEQTASPSSSELPQVTQDLSTQQEVPGAGADAVPSTADGPPAADNETAAVLSNDSVSAKFDARGNLIQLDLHKHAAKLGGDDMQLLYTVSADMRYNIQSGLIGAGLPSHTDDSWQVEKVNERTLTSTWEQDGISVLREYTLAESGYLATVSFSVTNRSDEAVPAHAYFQLVRDTSPPASYSALLPSFYGAVAYTSTDKYSKYDFDDLQDYPRKANDGWIGIVQRYFLAVWLNGNAARENFMRTLNNGNVSVGIIRPFGDIEPGATFVINQPLFAGALEQDLLEEIPPEIGQDLHLAVDYGWLTIVCQPLYALLALIERFAGNWGIAIILLTLLVKLAFYPLSSASFRSMAKMKQYAPKIQQLKERHGSDREAFQKAMMELYRKEKINPLGGCLPILIQIPVFIALYWVILGSVELRHEPLGLWISDLSAPDHLYILPILLGLVMFMQTKLNPTPPDPTQAMIMKIMPLGFAAFSIFFPSGLVLYWIANTVLSMMQQWVVSRSITKAQNSSSSGK